MNKLPDSVPAMRVHKPAMILLTVVAAATVLYGSVIMLLRTVQPAQLEIVEGKMLCEAYEVAIGNAIYNDPAGHGAATLCTPLHPLVLGSILKCVSPAFPWGRLLSLAATVIACVIIAGCRRGGTRGWETVLLTTAMFVSTAWITGWCAVLCRPDAMCHALWIIGLALLVRGGATGMVIAAAAFVLAFFTKQTAVIAIPGALIFLWLRSRRDLAVFGVLLAVLGAMAYAALHAVSGEWMPIYVFGRTAEQAKTVFSFSAILQYGSLLRLLPATMAGTILAAAAWRDYRTDPAFRLAWISLPFLLAGSVLTSSARFAGANSMMPVCYCLVFLAGYGVDHFLRNWSADVRAAGAALLLMGLQFDSSAPYHISKSLGRFDHDFCELVGFLRQEGGSMYCPGDNVVTLLAGYHNYGDRLLSHEIARQVPASIRWYREKLNACEVDWMILHKKEIPPDEILASSREAYEPVRDFGEWIVWKKRSGSRWKAEGAR